MERVFFGHSSCDGLQSSTNFPNDKCCARTKLVYSQSYPYKCPKSVNKFLHLNTNLDFSLSVEMASKLTYIKHNLILERPDLFKPKEVSHQEESIIEMMSNDEDTIAFDD